jgi:hypothetical protein
VRVAEDALPQQLEVLEELRVGVEARTGVVEVDVSTRIEAGEIAAAQLVDVGGVVVARVHAPKRRLRFRQRGCRLGLGV